MGWPVWNSGRTLPPRKRAIRRLIGVHHHQIACGVVCQKVPCAASAQDYPLFYVHMYIKTNTSAGQKYWVIFARVERSAPRLSWVVSSILQPINIYISHKRPLAKSALQPKWSGDHNNHARALRASLSWVRENMHFYMRNVSGGRVHHGIHIRKINEFETPPISMYNNTNWAIAAQDWRNIF